MSLKTLSADRAIARAKSHHRKNELHQARELYQSVLARFPENNRALNGLKALETSGSERPGRTLTQDQLDRVVTLFSGGKLSAALREVQDLINSHPNVPALHNLSGAIYAGLGQTDQAVNCYRTALRIKPNFAKAHSNLGNALRDLGQHEEAISNYRKALEIKPDYPEAHYNLGNVLKGLGRREEAISSYQKALKINPDLVEAHVNLGNVLKGLGRCGEAVSSYQKALEVKPDLAEAHVNLGTALQSLDKHEDAIDAYERALTVKPDFVEAHSNLGNAHRDLGRQHEAIASYHRALNIRPNNAEVHYNISQSKTYTPDDPQIEELQTLLKGTSATPKDRMNLNFALGKAYDDIDQTDHAFRHLVEGNELRGSELHYDIDQDRRLFNRIKSCFESSPSFADTEPFGDQGLRGPIFIVGMPRSGTSLVEQIIASHSEVFGAGELEAFEKIMLQLFYSDDGNSIKISKYKYKNIREMYLSELYKFNEFELIRTDKSLFNFKWVGFILTAFPNAKIVNVNREQMANFWSIYKHDFRSSGFGFACNFENIINYYKLYKDLMKFWHEKFPNTIYELNYEKLTENQEKETRKLLDCCDLGWEDRCLDFHRTERAVRTASALQVRKRMYKNSSQAWRRYEQLLEPMMEALGVSCKSRNSSQ